MEVKSSRSKKSTKSKRSRKPTLKTLGDSAIHYLSELDYMDILHLCQTNKEFSTFCHDDILFKTIIYNKLGIRVDKKYNVAEMLLELNRMIKTYIHDHYPTLPRYVNEELFYYDMERDIYDDLVDSISETFLDDFNYKTRKFKKSKSDYVKVYNQAATNFVTPLTSIYLDHNFDDSDEFYFKINKHLIQYLIDYAIDKEFNEDKDKADVLLFINPPKKFTYQQSDISSRSRSQSR